MTEAFRDRAERVIECAFGGKHHVASLRWEYRGYGNAVCTFLVLQGLSTYDFAQLTKLVVSCHDECVRGEIRTGGPGQLRIIITPRERKHKYPDVGAHPTLDQHVEQIRRGGSYQPLFNLLREGEDVKP
jgi:hypothetical protein